ncbi:hypothetical protein MMC31_002880 [Peltigera leucophlebia]|nr:hypothetical protein [Peltigera leucophlebia]
MSSSISSSSSRLEVPDSAPSSDVSSRKSSISRASTNGGTEQDELIDMTELPLESSKYGKIKNFSPWLPELDPEHPSAQKFHTKISNRTTVFCIQQLTAALVLVTNITLTAWAQARFGTHNGIGTIYLGSCAKAQRLDLWLHLLINILSTLLLGASNFCMQLLVAPTRDEVNKAHEKSCWLDIEDYQKNNDSWAPGNLDRIRRESITTYQELDNSHCIDRYINRLNGGKDVVVIVDKPSSQNDNSSLLGHFDVTQFPGRYWVCTSSYISPKVGTGGCTKWSMNQFRTNWTVVYDGRAFYSPGDPDEALALSCRSGGLHLEDDKCGLHFSTSIMTFVCVLNLLKCLLICWTAYYTGKSELLVTAGDALVSFLRTPDLHTQGMSTRSKQEFQKSCNWNSESRSWNLQKQRWYRAASLRRWGTALIL